MISFYSFIYQRHFCDPLKIVRCEVIKKTKYQIPQNNHTLNRSPQLAKLLKFRVFTQCIKCRHGYKSVIIKNIQTRWATVLETCPMHMNNIHIIELSLVVLRLLHLQVPMMMDISMFLQENPPRLLKEDLFVKANQESKIFKLRSSMMNGPNIKVLLSLDAVVKKTNKEF